MDSGEGGRHRSELALAALEERRLEVKDNLAFAVQKRVALDGEIHRLREERLRLTLEIAAARRSLDMPPDPSTEAQSGRPSASAVPDEGLEARLRGIEAALKEIHRRLSEDAREE